MQITFVSANAQENLKKLLISEPSTPQSIYLFASQDTIDYGAELAGKTRVLEEVALLSKKQNAVASYLAITSTQGHLRRSVAVADNGRIVGVSDMTRSGEKEIAPGACLRVYDTSQGKLGVIVADDLYFPDIPQALADCGAEYLLCLTPRWSPIDSCIVRAYAKCFSLPVLYCAEDISLVSDEKGELAFSSPLSPVSFKIERKIKYKLVQMRKRYQ